VSFPPPPSPPPAAAPHSLTIKGEGKAPPLSLKSFSPLDLSYKQQDARRSFLPSLLFFSSRFTHLIRGEFLFVPRIFSSR